MGSSCRRRSRSAASDRGHQDPDPGPARQAERLHRRRLPAVDPAARNHRSDDGWPRCVLTGRGRAFSSGVDLAELGRPGGQADLGANFDPLLLGLVEFPKPLLAAVNGLALGFGATILLLCDVVVIDESAPSPFPSLVWGPAWKLAAAGSFRRGWAYSRHLDGLSGRPVGADQAVATGLAVTTAATAGARLATIEMAATIADHPVPALVANKRLLRAAGPTPSPGMGTGTPRPCWSWRRQLVPSGGRASREGGHR